MSNVMFPSTWNNNESTAGVNYFSFIGLFTTAQFAEELISASSFAIIICDREPGYLVLLV